MIYTLTEESIEWLRRELANSGAVVKPRADGMYSVHHAAEWHEWQPTRSVITTNDALTLSAAHRLIQSLSEQTQSRSQLAECRDVMAALERMVEEG